MFQDFWRVRCQQVKGAWNEQRKSRPLSCPVLPALPPPQTNALVWIPCTVDLFLTHRTQVCHSVLHPIPHVGADIVLPFFPSPHPVQIAALSFASVHRTQLDGVMGGFSRIKVVWGVLIHLKFANRHQRCLIPSYRHSYCGVAILHTRQGPPSPGKLSFMGNSLPTCMLPDLPS